MISRRNLIQQSLILPVTGALSISVLSMRTAQSQARIWPTIAANDLNERPFSFPGDASGSPSLGVFVYRQQEQPEADRVMALVTAVAAANPGLALREFPVISAPVFARNFINNGMRSGIVGAKRAIVVTLYVPDMPAWKTATGFTNPRGVWLGRIKGASMSGAILSTQLRNPQDVQRFIDAS